MRVASLTWDGLADLRDRWKGLLIVKGLLHPEDAARAAPGGADAIVVSNHGGATSTARWPPSMCCRPW
jgi:isopentenyl diphosphate isomerase/L-lactate dehydrogenase-like FMN-dependent dehydrogenase